MKICPDNYEHVRGYRETEYEDSSLPLKRAQTIPSTMRTQDRIRRKGRAPSTVYQSQGVTLNGPPLPPWPNPRKSNSPLTTAEPPLYDSIEEVETVLKVTEPSKKVCIIA